jgi:uncharacterized protein (TIGR03083 family)
MPQDVGRVGPFCHVHPSEVAHSLAFGAMADDSELAALDPFALLDQEAARLDAFFSSLPESNWTHPSRCAGWTVRDVLAHLAASEEYHHACLDGDVGGFIARASEQGATDLDSANALGVDQYAGRAPTDILREWRARNAETRRRFRERGDRTVDTQVGDYPCRWQALHVASELATHADDVWVPVIADERDRRRDWRGRVSRFALAEAKPNVTVTHAHGRTHVHDADDLEVEVDDEELIEGVAARLDDSSRLPARARELLSAMP